MDISSIQNISNQYTKDSVSAGKLEENLKSDYSKASGEELMNACKEFEQYFVEQVFKEMRKTIPKSEESSGYMSTMKDYFEDSLYSEYAKSMTEQGDGVGLAKQLYEQMKRNYGIED